MVDQQAIRNAIKAGDSKQVAAFLAGNDEVLKMDTPFGSWLHVAASFGQVEIVKLLISLGIDKNTNGGIYDANALNEAADEGQLEVAQYLLSIGTEMDTSEPHRNPLFAAAQEGYLDIVKLLVEHGIAWDIKYSGENMTNMDAKAMALEWGQTNVVEYLESLE